MITVSVSSAGEVKGPSKTEFSEVRALQDSVTGDVAMDDTVLKIRQKVQEVRRSRVPQEPRVACLPH